MSVWYSRNFVRLYLSSQSKGHVIEQKLEQRQANTRLILFAGGRQWKMFSVCGFICHSLARGRQRNEDKDESACARGGAILGVHLCAVC